MHRWLTRIAILASSLLVQSIARADVAPTPGRPEWEHTPLPMPGDPPDAVAWLLLFAVFAALALFARRPAS